MLRLALSFVPSRAVAEEVVQDTWLAVLRGLAGFEGRSSLKTWLFTILVNRARTTGVREAQERFRWPTPGRWWTRPASALTGPGRRRPSTGSRRRRSRVDALKLTGLLRGALDGLPGRQREVVLLRDVEGLTSAEVCAVLSISEGNQRVLLHRGRGKLRQVLESELGGVAMSISPAWRVPPPDARVPAGRRDGDGYLEGALSRSDRRRLEQHLAGCPHCTEYLAQMRETIRLAGRLAPDDLTPEMRPDLTELYRRWLAEG